MKINQKYYDKNIVRYIFFYNFEIIFIPQNAAKTNMDEEENERRSLSKTFQDIADKGIGVCERVFKS